MEKLYTCKDVANRYGVVTHTVWAWIRDKRLTAVKIGKYYRIKETDLVAFELENLTVCKSKKGLERK